MSERLDGDRIIVTGYSGGSHFPRTQAETLYRFEANGLEQAFHIEGAVYGRDVRLRGPGTLVGPLLGRGDVILENAGATPQRLLGGLHATGHVGCARTGTSLRASLVAGLERAAYVVRGDVVGESVALDNAVVLGNVRGTHVQLTRCLVLGQVLAREDARIGASTVLSYETQRVRIEGPSCLVFGAGVSDHAPEFGAWHDGDREWPADLRLLPLLRAAGYPALTARPWEDMGNTADSRLWPSDWLCVTATRNVTFVRGGQRQDEAVPVERHVLSIGGRILNFREAERWLDHFVWLLKTAFEFEHYHPERRRDMRRRWADACTPDEVLLLDLTLGEAAPTTTSG